MRSLVKISFATALAAACLQQPAEAQIPAVVHGRIEDAVTRAPLVEVRVSSADSSVFVLTDSMGTFSIEVGDRSAIALLAERFGYVTDRFDLAEDATSSVTVLLLEPEPVELAGIEVEAQAALDAVLVQLENRRNIYPSSVRTYDGTDLAETTAYGSAWEFLKARIPQMYECSTSISGLCIGNPPSSFLEPADQTPSWGMRRRSACASTVWVGSTSRRRTPGASRGGHSPGAAEPYRYRCGGGSLRL